MRCEEDYYGIDEFYGHVNCSAEIERIFERATEHCTTQTLLWDKINSFDFRLSYFNEEEGYMLCLFNDGAVVVHANVTADMYDKFVGLEFPEEYYYKTIRKITIYRYIISHYNDGDRLTKLAKEISGVWTADELVDIIVREGYTSAEIKSASRNKFGVNVDMRYKLGFILFDMKERKGVKWTTYDGYVENGFTLLSKESPLINEAKNKDIGDVVDGRYVLIKGY